MEEKRVEVGVGVGRTSFKPRDTFPFLYQPPPFHPPIESFIAPSLLRPARKSAGKNKTSRSRPFLLL